MLSTNYYGQRTTIYHYEGLFMTSNSFLITLGLCVAQGLGGHVATSRTCTRATGILTYIAFYGDAIILRLGERTYLHGYFIYGGYYNVFTRSIGVCVRGGASIGC